MTGSKEAQKTLPRTDGLLNIRLLHALGARLVVHQPQFVIIGCRYCAQDLLRHYFLQGSRKFSYRFSKRLKDCDGQSIVGVISTGRTSSQLRTLYQSRMMHPCLRLTRKTGGRYYRCAGSWSLHWNGEQDSILPPLELRRV